MSIKLEVLARLPAGKLFGDVSEHRDQFGELHQAIRWMIASERHTRIAWFDVNDGSYLGEL